MLYRLGWTWWSYTSVFLSDSYSVKTSHFKSTTHVIRVSDSAAKLKIRDLKRVWT